MHFDLSSEEVLVTELVAQRLFEASLFGIFENLMFHADPHPANVVVRAGSEIVLIDSGSCGSYKERQLNIRRFIRSTLLYDTLAVGGVALAAVGVARVVSGQPLDARELVATVLKSPWFLGFGVLFLFASVRQVLFRFQDREV